MERVILRAALAFGSLLLFAGSANAANTYRYLCTNTAGELQLRLNGTNAWTSTNGGAGTTAKPVDGDTIEIDGTNKDCLGDIFVDTTGLRFTNHNDSGTVQPLDEINGMFEVAGARITINGISVTCTACSTSITNTTGLSTFAENGALLLHDGAVALIENAQINNGKTSGIFMTRNVALSAISTVVAGNGLNATEAPFASGIFAENGSTVRLGNPDSTGGVFLGGNGKSGGGCPGFGILLTRGSSLESFAAGFGGFGTANDVNSQNTCGQILLQSGSSALIEGTSITQTTASSPAIQALGNSSFVATNAPGPATVHIQSGDNGAVLLGAVSSAVLNFTTISSTGTSLPTIEAAGSSTITLAGNNLISNNTGGGTVFQIDHSSSLTQVPGQNLGFQFAQAENITGSAFVQVQSSMDLGIGTIGGTPSINWSVPAGSCILIQQNSSFRMSGGVAITGAPAAACGLNGGTVSTTVVFQQESNGFFNVSRGGTDNISGGAVSCLFAGMPNAHITGKANISPAGAQPVIIGSWSSANTAISPGCLGP